MDVVIGSPGRYVKVVNRTNKLLRFTWMGRHYEIKPNEETGPMHEQLALAARNQNPIFGSEDEFGGQDSYVAIVGEEDYNHDASPIEWSKATERFDFSGARLGQGVIVALPGKGYSTEGRYLGTFGENKVKADTDPGNVGGGSGFGGR